MFSGTPCLRHPSLHAIRNALHGFQDLHTCTESGCSSPGVHTIIWPEQKTRPHLKNPTWLLLIFNLLESLRLCPICKVYISGIGSLLANTARAQLGFTDSCCLVGERHSQTLKTLPLSPPVLKDFCNISRSLQISSLSIFLLTMFFSLLT